MERVTLPSYWVASLALSLLLVGCVERFEVAIKNHLDTEALVRVGQYHSEGFDGTPPRTFDEKLLIQQQDVQLQPGEVKTLVFNSASGGFWLRWQQLQPGRMREPLTLDLIRDARVINVRGSKNGA